jgi:hypothetical protein
LSGNEIPDEHRLAVHKMEARRTVLRRLLRNDWIVTRTSHLNARGYNQRDIGCSPVGGVIMERKPPCGIHQI